METAGAGLGSGAFETSGEVYDAFMGRYSRPLADLFADAAGVVPGMTVPGMTVLDVGCGPGALTGVLVDRLGVGAVSACDPSAPFVAACARRHPGVEVRQGRAEALPFEDDAFDGVLAELVLHFVGDPPQAAAELARVLRPGGTVAACVWDLAEGMEMLRHFWEAARAVNPAAPDEGRALPFGRSGEIVALWASAGFEELSESTLRVTTAYADFDELWNGFLGGVGPAGGYLVGLPPEARDEVRATMYRGLGSPIGPFGLGAAAWCAVGRAPAVS